MKKIFAIIISVLLSGVMCFSQDVKRPESYNYQSGVEAYGNENYATSMEYFDKELEQNPKNGYAMLWKAYIYDNYEKYGQALTNANQSIKYIPKKDKEWIAMAYGLKAKVQAELGDTVKALSDYDTAFKQYQDLDYIYKKCNILHQQHRYQDVDTELQKALKYDENNAVTRVYLGRNETQKGNYAKALEYYDYAIKLEPNYASAFSFRADTHIATHKYKEACQDVISALNIDTDQKAFSTLYTLADSAMTQLSTQLKAQQLRDPNEAQWSYYLGIMKAYVGDYAGAEQPLRDAIRITEVAGDKKEIIYTNLAETLTELGRYSEALDMIDVSLSLDSTDTRIWKDRADIFYQTNKNMAAIECNNKMIELQPDNDLYYSYRARNYMYAKLNRNALDDINTAITLDPDYSYYLLQRSEIYYAMGKKAEAEADCKTVIEMESAKPAAEQSKETLTYAQARLGNRNAVYELIDKIYKKQTKEAEYNKACLLSIANDQIAALQHFEKALELGYCEFTHINNDYDLDNIRNTDKFKRLVEQYKQKYTDNSSVASDADEGEYEEQKTEIPFTKESGIYKVKCTINELPLHFYFDTGAADVTISSVEAQFMLKNGYLKKSDIKGKSYYGDANGDISEGTVILLQKVSFGGLELSNVRASVVHNQRAPLLLGQTVLSRLGKIEIDYNKKVIKVTSRKRK